MTNETYDYFLYKLYTTYRCLDRDRSARYKISIEKRMKKQCFLLDPKCTKYTIDKDLCEFLYGTINVNVSSPTFTTYTPSSLTETSRCSCFCEFASL